VYEYVYSDICPDCGKDTHEPNRELDSKLFKEYYKSGEHLKWKCPIDGGTIRGWWSI
jgi:rRNA maturation protein Nop10